jgi:hypothetical protein
MKQKGLIHLASIAVLLSLLLTGCGSSTPEPTSVPTTGTIKGKILRSDGKSLVDEFAGEYGYVILICAGTNIPKSECLREQDLQKDVSEILASICDTVDQSPHCKFHKMIGADDISHTGSYIFPAVFPGDYDLLLIVVSNGIAMTVQLTDVDSVQAGETVEYDFTTQ